MPTLNKHLFLLMRFIFANTIIVDFGRLRCPLADAALVSLFHMIFLSACVCLWITSSLFQHHMDFHSMANLESFFVFTLSPAIQVPTLASLLLNNSCILELSATY